MSENRYDFWVHGTNTFAQNPEKAAQIVRDGSGTTVVQAGGTEGWFHIPLVRPTGMHGKHIKIDHVRLRGRINQHAKIDAVQVRRGHTVVHTETYSPGLTAQEINEPIGYMDNAKAGGNVLSVHVHFLEGESMGEVTFMDVGAVFFAVNS